MSLNPRTSGAASFHRGAMVVLLLSLLVLFSVHEAYALESAQSLGSSDITLTPQYPQANESVRATVETSYVNLNTALITWKENGTVVQQGYGVRDYQFDTGAIGSRSVLEVTAVAPNGRSVHSQEVVLVSDVALVWEGETYTPPLYKGRALVPAGAAVRLLALPTIPKTDGSLYTNDELTYEWSINGAYAPSEVGRGLESVTLSTPQPFDAFRVGIKIRDPAGEVRVLRTFDVPRSSARLLYYIDSPLFGILHEQALGRTYSMSSQQEVLVVEPYFIETDSRAGKNVVYEWTIGGQEIPARGSIVLAPQGSAASTARVVTRVNNSETSFQSAQQETTIRFNAHTDSNGVQTTTL